MLLKYFLYKEVRKKPSFFLLVLILMILGTFSLLALSLVGSQVEQKLKDHSKFFLTSDFSINARRDFSPNELILIRKIVRNFSKNQFKSYKVVDLYSMVSFAKANQDIKNDPKLVEIRATQAGFPFHGKLDVLNGEFSSEKLFVSRSLADLWNLNVGDLIKVGELSLPISGIVTQDSSIGLRGVSLAPRLYFPLIQLEKTGLLNPGVTGSFALHFRFPSSQVNLKELQKKIYQQIEDSFIKVTLPEDSSRRTSRALGFIINFMSLASLVGLLLSLVGVFYIYQSQMMSRLKDYCLFYLHGMRKDQIIKGVLSQFVLLFLMTIFFDFFLIVFFFPEISQTILQLTGVEIGSLATLPKVFAQLGFLFFLSLSVIFPLITAFLRTPLLAQLKSTHTTMIKLRWFDFLPFMFLLFCFSWFLSHSFYIGSLFYGALLIIFILSLLFIRAFQYSLKTFLSQKKLRMPIIMVGLAAKGIQRSGHRLIFTFLSLSLSVSLMSFIIQLNEIISQEFSMDKKRPALFVFDIQENQLTEFKDFITSRGSELQYITPLVRARILKVNDKVFVKKRNELSVRDPNLDDELRNNTVNLTFRDYLTSAEKIVEGMPFQSHHQDMAQVSLEKRWSQRMGIDLHDELLFDVQGVEIKARVVNIKEIKWTSFYPNFFITLAPGIIDEAPKTYVASLPNDVGEGKRQIQRLALRKFPNISFIDVEDFLSKIYDLFEKSRSAISLMAIFSLVIGFIILYGLSFDQVLRKKYDLALLNSLGLTPQELIFYLLLEFGVIFILAQLIGVLTGWSMAQMIGVFVFKVTPSFYINGLAPLVAIVSLLCFITIYSTSLKVTKQKSMKILSE